MSANEEILKELITIANKELYDSRKALWDEQSKFQRNDITSNVKLKELEERHEANVKQLKELVDELHPIP